MYTNLNYLVQILFGITIAIALVRTTSDEMLSQFGTKEIFHPTNQTKQILMCKGWFHNETKQTQNTTGGELGGTSFYLDSLYGIRS